MPAALVAFADFIYCVPQTYLLTPFTSLGLISEAASSIAFADRMGSAKANEALLLGKRLSSKDLLQAGFVNEIFACQPEDLRETIISEVGKRFHDGLNASSILETKRLIRQRMRRELDAQSVEEVFVALDRNVKGIPQKEFEKLRQGQKKHKL
jgi:Delta3-Delta2-enoyl-CoA isomerase